jgi:hypothetical protein
MVGRKPMSRMIGWLLVFAFGVCMIVNGCGTLLR